MLWSAKQLQVRDAIFDDGVGIDRPLVIWGGPQTGKTMSAVWFWCAWVVSRFSETTHMIVSHRDASYRSNILKHVRWFCQSAGLHWGTNSYGFWIESLSTKGAKNYFVVKTVSNLGHIDSIYSDACVSIFDDESTRKPEDTFRAERSRLSQGKNFGAKWILAMNPSHEDHWIKRQFIDSGQCVPIQFTFDDNPAIDPAYVQSVADDYGPIGSAMYKRMFLHEWASETGMIFANVEKAFEPYVRTDAENYQIWWDSAAHGRTAALLVACHSDGLNHVISEWYWDNHKQPDLVEEEQIKRIMDQMVAGRKLQCWYGDKAYVALEFRRAAETLQNAPVIPADNDVELGINAVRKAMHTGVFKIDADACPNLRRQMRSYRRMDSITANRDTPPVYKHDDDGPDAVRYGHTGQLEFQRPRGRQKGRRISVRH